MSTNDRSRDGALSVDLIVAAGKAASMKNIFQALSLSLILAFANAQILYAELDGTDDSLITMTVRGTNSRTEKVGIQSDELKKQIRSSAILFALGDPALQSPHISAIYPLKTDFVSFDFKRSPIRFTPESNPVYVTTAAYTVAVKLLLVGKTEQLSAPESEVVGSKVVVFDGGRYVKHFDYPSRLVGFSLSQLLTYSPDTGTVFKPIVQMPPATIARFIALNQHLREVQKEVPAVKFRLALMLEFRQGPSQLFPIASGNSDVYKSIRPGFLGQFSKNYRAAEALLGRKKCAAEIASIAKP